MKKQIITLAVAALLLSSCGIYTKYERPEVKTDGLYGQDIEVRNNGTPIPQEVLPHIFVPFFTTKETGSGIGLSLSRYIMRLHGGNLKHYVVREWTVFGMVF